MPTTTYVPTHQGWLYLAVVLASGCRMAMDADNRTDGDGLRDATVLMAGDDWAPASFGSRQPVWRGGLSAPRSAAVSGASMSRPGNCCDYAVVESLLPR
jgi:transposase InsO family protein